MRTTDGLLAGATEGALSPKEEKAVTDALLESPAARRRYLEFALVQSALVDLAGECPAERREAESGRPKSRSIAMKGGLATMAASLVYAAITWWSLTRGIPHSGPEIGKGDASEPNASVKMEGPAAADDSNPSYSAWSGFKPGAWVLQKWNNETVLFRLVEVTPESVTVDRLSAGDVPWWEHSSYHRQTYAAKPDADAVNKAPKPRSTKEGDETVTVKGKALRCHWIEQDWNPTYSTRGWTSRDVPGGYVKSRYNNVDQTPKGPAVKAAREDTIIDWGTDPTAADVENPHYNSWKNFKVGASVTLKVSFTLPTEARGAMPDQEETWTLSELTEDRAVLDGPPTKGGKITIPRRIPRVAQTTSPAKQKEGAESVTVDARAVACRWIQSARSYPETAGTFAATLWRSETIPGNLVQLKEENPFIIGKSVKKSIRTISLVRWNE